MLDAGKFPFVLGGEHSLTAGRHPPVRRAPQGPGRAAVRCPRRPARRLSGRALLACGGHAPRAGPCRACRWCRSASAPSPRPRWSSTRPTAQRITIHWATDQAQLEHRGDRRAAGRAAGVRHVRHRCAGCRGDAGDGHADARRARLSGRRWPSCAGPARSATWWAPTSSSSRRSRACTPTTTRLPRWPTRCCPTRWRSGAESALMSAPVPLPLTGRGWGGVKPGAVASGYRCAKSCVTVPRLCCIPPPPTSPREGEGSAVAECTYSPSLRNVRRSLSPRIRRGRILGASRSTPGVVALERRLTARAGCRPPAEVTHLVGTGLRITAGLQCPVAVIVKCDAQAKNPARGGEEPLIASTFVAGPHRPAALGIESPSSGDAAGDGAWGGSRLGQTTPKSPYRRRPGADAAVLVSLRLTRPARRDRLTPRGTGARPRRIRTGRAACAAPAPRGRSRASGPGQHQAGVVARGGQQLREARHLGDAELRHAALAGTQHLAAAAQLQILLGDQEAVLGVAPSSPGACAPSRRAARL